MKTIKQRKQYSSEFKARVAIEALKNIRTTAQIAKEFEIHPAQVSEWKKQMLDGATGLFGAGKPQQRQPSGSPGLCLDD